MGKNLSTLPYASTLTNLQISVGSTIISLTNAPVDTWNFDTYDYGTGNGPQIEYYTTNASGFLTDITNAGFAMQQFYQTGQITATLDGIPNNIMNVVIPPGGPTEGAPNPGYPGGTTLVSTGGTGGGAQPANYSTLTTDHGNVCTPSTDIIANQGPLVSAPNTPMQLGNVVEIRDFKGVVLSAVSTTPLTIAQVESINGPSSDGSFNWDGNYSTMKISAVDGSGTLIPEPGLVSLMPDPATASSFGTTNFVWALTPSPTWEATPGLSYGYIYFTAPSTQPPGNTFPIDSSFSAADNAAIDLFATNGGSVSYIDTRGYRVSFTVSNSILWSAQYLSNYSDSSTVATATPANARTYCAGVIDTKVASNSYGNSFYLVGDGKFNYTDAVLWGDENPDGTRARSPITGSMTSWNTNSSYPSHSLDLYYWDSTAPTPQLTKFYTDTAASGLCNATILLYASTNNITSYLNCNTSDPTIIANLNLMVQNGGALSFVDPITGKRISTYYTPATSTNLPSWVGSSLGGPGPGGL